jgi:hypothetical protein
LNIFLITKTDDSRALKAVKEIATLKQLLGEWQSETNIGPKSPFSFSQTVEAFSYLNTNKAIGKIVIHLIP